MKKSALMVVFFILVLALGVYFNSEKEVGPNDENSTTFAAWGEMTTEQQGDWVKDYTWAMYYYFLQSSKPSKAQCMEDRFLVGIDNNESTVSLIEFNQKVDAVLKEQREERYVEAIFADYIGEELCGDVDSTGDEAALKKAFFYASVTFDDWDKMTKEEQDKFLGYRAGQIYTWIHRDEKARADCVYQKITVELEKGQGLSDVLKALNKKFSAVPADQRAISHVNTLITDFIIKELCGDENSKAQDKDK